MVLAIIQARYGSQRFPGKMLADLCGRPVIQHVCERALQIRGVDHVVLALADDPAEQPLHEWARQSCPCDSAVMIGVDVNDVLGRFAAILRLYPTAGTVVRLTGDCPLLQPLVCERVLELYQSSACLYAWTDTHSGDWFDGTDCEVFDATLLLAADAADDVTAEDREHVTPWLRRLGSVALPPDPQYACWPKVSIDTLEDLERVRRLIGPSFYCGRPA